MEHAVLEVHVVVAVSETGMVEASVIDNCWAKKRQSHQAWLEKLRNDNKLWTIKTIKTHVPMPRQFEDQTKPCSE